VYPFDFEFLEADWELRVVEIVGVYVVDECELEGGFPFEWLLEREPNKNNLKLILNFHLITKQQPCLISNHLQLLIAYHFTPVFFMSFYACRFML